MNGNAVAAMTVPMLARIDGTNQYSVKQVEVLLRQSVASLSQKIALNINTPKIKLSK
jgi:hypothetical protein